MINGAKCECSRPRVHAKKLATVQSWRCAETLASETMKHWLHLTGGYQNVNLNQFFVGLANFSTERSTSRDYYGPLLALSLPWCGRREVLNRDGDYTSCIYC